MCSDITCMWVVLHIYLQKVLTCMDALTGAASGFSIPLSQLQPGQNLVQILFLFPGQLRFTQNITLQRTVPRKTELSYITPCNETTS